MGAGAVHDAHDVEEGVGSCSIPGAADPEKSGSILIFQIQIDPSWSTQSFPRSVIVQPYDI